MLLLAPVARNTETAEAQEVQGKKIMMCKALVSPFYQKINFLFNYQFLGSKIFASSLYTNGNPAKANSMVISRIRVISMCPA